MPIRWRLTLFIALAIGAILVLLGLALYLVLRGALNSDLEGAVGNRAHTAARKIEAGGDLDDSTGGFALDGVFVAVRDDNGDVLREVGLPQGSGGAVWRRAMSSGEAASGTVRFSKGEEPYYVRAVPVSQPEDGPAHVVEAGKSYEPVMETMEVFGTVLAAGIGVALLVSAFGAYFLAGAALGPVEAVSRAAGEMGEDDLSERLPVANPGDEIGRLTIAINGLLSRLEAAFARREEALERQRRFAADASHELRTPLTSISGHARMLDEWALEEDPQRAKRSVGAIRAAAGRMRNLVESLLILTRGDESANLDVGRHDLAAVAEEAAQAARTAADGKVSVEYVRPKRAVEATFDRDRVFQVASILLDNAVKYTPEGGSVLVRVEEEGGRAALEVSDTGVAIPEDELPLIFERFHRTDRSRTDSGVGLGLSIARQIAEAHGGEIRASSTQGKGSTFTLLLPQRSSTTP